MAQHGADAMRLYLINSPLVRAEELRFSEQGVRDTVRRLLLPWWNAYKFFVTYAQVDGWRPDHGVKGKREVLQSPSVITSPLVDEASPNILDRWILSRQQTLIRRVNAEMDAYRLYTVVPALLDFLNELTNWYVRLNRRRFWGATGNVTTDQGQKDITFPVDDTTDKKLRLPQPVPGPADLLEAHGPVHAVSGRCHLPQSEHASARAEGGRRTRVHIFRESGRHVSS